MNRIKPNTPATGFKQSPGNLAGQQQQPAAQNSNIQLQQPLPQPLLANYTLPGVISYLTSEFTNLERFKIMTNLEKLEMKYRIQELTAEINSLKFLNDKQAVRIAELETRLAGQPKDLSQSESDKERLLTSLPSSSLQNQAPSGVSVPDYGIPPVDLEVLRSSRQKLNKSIKDVYRLLKPPSVGARSILDFPGADNADYGELMQDVGSDEEEKAQLALKIDSIFAKYTLTSDDLLLERKETIEEEANEIIRALEEEEPPKTRHNLAEESDAETVIVDEPEEAHMLTIDESELVKSSRELQIRLGSVVHVPAPSPSSKVYPPFQHSFVVIQGRSLTVWHRSTQVLSGEIDDECADVIGAFYLEKNRVVLILRSGVVMYEQKQESDSLLRFTLQKEDKMDVSLLAVVEFGKVVAGKLVGVAYAGKSKDGKFSAVVLEVKTGQKVATKTAAQFSSPLLELNGDLTSLHWHEHSKQHTEGLPKLLLPKKSTSLDLSHSFDLLYAHGKLLKVSIALKGVADVYKNEFDSAEVSGGYALLKSSSVVTLLDLASNKVISSQPVKPHAHYSLLYKQSPYIVQADDVQISIFDSQFREVATSPNCDGLVLLTDADFVVVQSKQEVRITAIEGAD